MSEQHANTSRRDFLGTAAALGAAAALGTAAGKAAARPHRPLTPRVKPMRGTKLGPADPIRMAVIGTGGMGTGHCNSICELAKQGRTDTQIVAVADVCDSHRMRAKNSCQQSQGIDVDDYRDYREVLARDDIHGVLIATPEHWHAQCVVDALEAGKDVYCEKPMTLNFDMAMDVRKAVLAHPERIFQVGTQKMILPKYVKAREVIKSGLIGKPVWSQTSYCRNTPAGEWNYYGIDPSWKPGVNVDWETWLGSMGPRAWDPKVFIRWRRYRDFSTGIIGDLLVHEVTPMVNALDPGWPTRVTAIGGHYIDKEMENFDQVNLTIQFGQTDHTMIVAGATNNEVGLETMIRGNKGNIYLGSRHCVVRPERPYVDDFDAETIECPDIGNDQDGLRLNWLECIRSREPAVSNIDLASKVMVMVDLATRSMWEGKTFAFDPDTMKTRAL